MVESQPASLDTKEVWYSNMHLLGFQPSLCDEKYKVRFEKDMFVHINMKGSEVILHFLFSKLDSHLSYEEFRYEHIEHIQLDTCLHNILL